MCERRQFPARNMQKNDINTKRAYARFIFETGTVPAFHKNDMLNLRLTIYEGGIIYSGMSLLHTDGIFML